MAISSATWTPCTTSCLHVYPNRCDNEAYISQRVDLTAINAYLARKNETETGISATPCSISSWRPSIKTITLRPKMNRFIANKNFYQRNERLAVLCGEEAVLRQRRREALAFLHAKDGGHPGHPPRPHLRQQITRSART